MICKLSDSGVARRDRGSGRVACEGTEEHMRQVFLAAIAAAAILSGGSVARSTEAMAPAAPAAYDALVWKVVNVCGTRGCALVQTKRVIRRQKPGEVAKHHI